MKRWIIPSIVALCVSAPCLADVVHLKDGRQVEGTIIEQTDQKVVVKTKFGMAEFPKADVVRIENKETPDQEFARRRADAGKDADKLFDLYLWAKQNGLDKNAMLVLKDVIKVDPDHENARKLLGYTKYGDKWVTDKELERLKKDDLRKANEAKGLVEYKGEWLTPEQKETKLHEEKGEVLIDGAWVNRNEVERAKKAASARAEAEEHKAKGEFLVNGKWVSRQEAEAYYRDIKHPYIAEADHVRLFTNKGIEAADSYLVTAEAAYRKAAEFFGKEPDAARKLNVIVCAAVDEYKALGVEWGAEKSSNFAAFCTPWLGKNDLDVDLASVTHYYQSQQNTELFITHAVVDQYMTRLLGPTPGDLPPDWFIDGVSSYLERWQSARLFAWARDNLVRAGGLSSFKTFFKSYGRQEKQIHQAGSMVAYLKSPDTKEELRKSFDTAMEAFLGGTKMQKAFKDLEKKLLENEDEFLNFFEK